MKTFEKIMKVFAKNMGMTIVLIAAIILFAIFSKGLLAGIISALSALVAYACCLNLYKEIKMAMNSGAKASKNKKVNKK